MRNSDLSAALLAFDFKELEDLLDEIIVDYDLTFGYLDGLRKVTPTDRRDKLTIIGYRPTLTEALSYVLEVWRSIQTVEEAARFFADWRNGDEGEIFAALPESEAA